MTIKNICGAAFHTESPFNPNEINLDNIRGYVQEAARQCASDFRFHTKDGREFALFMRGDTIPRTDWLLTPAERNWMKAGSFIVEVVHLKVDEDGEVSGDGYYHAYSLPEDAKRAWFDLHVEHGVQLVGCEHHLMETLAVA